MRILVVDDDETLCGNVAKILSFDYHAVDTACSGTEAIDLIEYYAYDLLVLDWMMPGVSGVDVCKYVRQRRYDGGILMLTAKDANEDIVAGLDAGADDYLVKPFEMAVLRARVRALLGIFIYFVYKKTFNGVVYSHSFNISLMIMSLATALVIMGISQNVLLSLGMVGALSIVRFRTPIKDPMDLIFLFWSVVVGILCGAGFIPLAVMGSIIIGLTIIVFQHKIVVDTPYLVVVRFDIEETNLAIEQLLNNAAKRYLLKSKSAMSDIEMEVTYEVRLKGNDAALVSQLLKLQGVSSAIMLSYDGNFTA
ncbi:response regulator [Caryophanon tenue]|nr:response regulator [Caryophanon tenue]